MMLGSRARRGTQAAHARPRAAGRGAAWAARIALGAASLAAALPAAAAPGDAKPERELTAAQDVLRWRPGHAAEPLDFLRPDVVPEAFRDEDAVVLFAGDYVILHDDGRIDRGSHRVVRLNTDYAIDRYGDPRVPYDTLRQELVVHSCRTYTPDGRIVAAKEHALNRVTPDDAAGCPDALPRQELVLTHLGVERGCVVEWDVEIRDRVAHAPWLEGTLFFPDDDPVVRRVISVKVPAAAALRATVVNGAIEAESIASPAADGEGPAAIRIWRAENLPAVREHDDGCGGRLARAHLLFTTCSDWTALCNRLLEDLAAAGRADEAMHEWLDEMNSRPATLTAADEARAIADLTANEVSAVGIGGFAGYLPPRTAARTFATRCGGAWDRAALAFALLAEADLAPRIALRPASRLPLRDLPMLGQFEGVLLGPRAEDSAALWFVDPASGRIFAETAAHADRPLFFVGAPDAVSPGWCEGGERELRAGRADIAVTLVQDEGRRFHGSVEVNLSGALRPGDEMEDLAAFTADYAGRLVPGAKPVAARVLEVTPRAARVRFDFEVADLGADRDGLTRLRPCGGPVALKTVLSPYRLHRPRRTSPVFLGGALSERVSWRMRLKDGGLATRLPEPERLSNEAGSYELICEDRPAPGEGTQSARWITIGWQIDIPGDTLSPEEAPALGRLMQVYEAESGRLVILAL